MKPGETEKRIETADERGGEKEGGVERRMNVGKRGWGQEKRDKRIKVVMTRQFVRREGKKKVKKESHKGKKGQRREPKTEK